MENTKRLIGHTIGIYRKYYQSHYVSNHFPGIWSKRGFINNLKCLAGTKQCKNCKIVCEYEDLPYMSRTTLKRIEKGGVTNKILYDELIARLGYKYIESDFNVDAFTKELYEVFIESKVSVMVTFLDHIEDIFVDLKHYFFYRDLYELSKSIIEYQLYRKPFSKQQTEKYFYLLMNINESLYQESQLIEMIYNMVFVMYGDFYYNNERLRAIYTKLPLFTKTPLVLFMQSKLIVYYEKMSMMQAMSILEEVYKKYKNEKNSYRMFEALMGMGFICAAIDVKEADKIYHKAEILLKEGGEEIPKHRLGVLYFNLVSLNYFGKENLEKALWYINKMGFEYGNSKYKLLIIKVHIMGLLKQEIRIEEICEINLCDDEDYKKILSYFIIKKNAIENANGLMKKSDARRCSDYIVRELFDIFKDKINDYFLILIFYKEMQVLNEYCNNAKDIVEMRRLFIK